MGGLNGDLGNSLGDKGLKEPNERGKLLLDFANYFNLCPINLLTICDGPLETYFSHCGKYRSTIDYIFLPNCLQNSIVMSKTFDLDIDNTSDHQPVIAKLEIIQYQMYCMDSTVRIRQQNGKYTGQKSVRTQLMLGTSIHYYLTFPN